MSRGDSMKQIGCSGGTREKTTFGSKSSALICLYLVTSLCNTKSDIEIHFSKVLSILYLPLQNSLSRNWWNISSANILSFSRPDPKVHLLFSSSSNISTLGARKLKAHKFH